MTTQMKPTTIGEHVVAWSMSNPSLIVLLMVFLVAWGAFNFTTMSRREDPEIKIATALVITPYPGAGAETVETQVTQKLETHIATLGSLKKQVSTTRANLSVIHVDVAYETDTDFAWQKLRTLVEEARSELPQMAMAPIVWDNFGDTTAMIVAFTGDTPVQLRQIADDVQTELGRLSCTGEIRILGDIPEVVYVEGRRAELARHGVTPYQVKQALEMRNLKVPAGRIQNDTYQFLVEPTGAYDSARAIEDTIVDVSTETGQPVYVRDLFRVTRSMKTPPDMEMHIDGVPGVGVGIVMKKGCNVVALGEAVRDRLADIQTHLPSGIHMKVVHDSPRQVNTQVNDFTLNLVGGIGLVVIFMALFMGIRPAIISASSIPLSVFISLSLMPLLNIDLEMVSIAAFIVALGMLVDNSIIVTDNIDIKRQQGLSLRLAAYRGASELMRAVVIGTLGTVAAFMPMLLLRDEIGAYTRALPLVVTVSLLASILVSQTLTPLMAYYMGGPVHTDKPAVENRIAARVYRRIVELCLRRKPIVIVMTLLALGGAGVLLRMVGFSFFPDANRDQFTVDIWMAEGTTLAETRRIAMAAEARLSMDKDVTGTVTYVGEGGPRFYITVMPEFPKTNYAQLMVNTASPEATSHVIARFNAHARNAWPGARVYAKKLVMGMPIEAPVEIRVFGDDIPRLRSIGEDIKAILRHLPETSQIRDNFGPDVASLQIDIDEEKANRVGITNTDVALAFLSTYEGFELTRFNDNGQQLSVVLRLTEEERGTQSDLAGLPVASTVTGEKVPLSSIAEVNPHFGAGVIVRRDGQRCLTVQAWTRHGLPDAVIQAAWPRISALDLPGGYRIEIGGEKEEMDKSFHDLLVVFGVIVALLLLLLVVQTRTVRRALIVLITAPLSIVGASIGLFIGGFSFSFMAFLGIVALAGMAIKNTVVWIDNVEQRRSEGASIHDSVIMSGIYRLRPILLASFTTIGGLLPLALFGGVLFEPMAYAMIGGLSLVTLFTLIVIPVFYVALMPRDNQ